MYLLSIREWGLAKDPKIYVSDALLFWCPVKNLLSEPREAPPAFIILSLRMYNELRFGSVEFLLVLFLLFVFRSCLSHVHDIHHAP